MNGTLSPDNGFKPAGLIDSPRRQWREHYVNTEFGSVDTSGTATHNLVEYRDPTSGALVFGAGTVFWSWGLADQGTTTLWQYPSAGPKCPTGDGQSFRRYGCPALNASGNPYDRNQTTDHTPPTSKISSVSTNTPVEGQTVTVTGTATDAGGGVIAGVDSRRMAARPGTQQIVRWCRKRKLEVYFHAPAPGAYMIESRAVDDSLNLETPGPGVSYTVSPSTALTLFSPALRQPPRTKMTQTRWRLVSSSPQAPTAKSLGSVSTKAR